MLVRRLAAVTTASALLTVVVAAAPAQASPVSCALTIAKTAVEQGKIMGCA
jgi:hypothetical protein